MIDLARRRLEHFWNLRHNRPFGQAIQRLFDYQCGLLDLFHPAKVTIVRVAVLANRNLEVEIRVRRVRLRLSNVVFYARPSQCRSSQAEVNRLFSGQNTDTNRALKPDSVSVE